MLAGITWRSRKDQRTYDLKLQSATTDECYFCAANHVSVSTVAATKHFIISRNTFPYKVWDGCGVIDHLILSPRRHINALSELSTDEQVDYMAQLARYEAKGYSVYTRSPTNRSRSIAHQHTHFILTDNQPKTWLFYLRKPSINISK